MDYPGLRHGKGIGRDSSGKMKDAPDISRPRFFAYASIAVVLGFAVALSGADLALSWQTRRIQAAEKIDPGLLVYDRQLGWRMAADWHGRHTHYDFDVRYNTNPLGLRGTWPQIEGDKRRYALLGDSFTFGLGVDDGETFAARLNQENPNAAFLNIGLAGYSTDQQYLYLKDRLASWQADEVWLIVYLANDLFDNTLGYPLQAQMAKPYFAQEDGNLVLRNVPVPLNPSPEPRHALAEMVLGPERMRAMGANPLFRNGLIHRLGFFSSSSEDIEADFPQRFAYPLSLFFKLVEAMRQECSREGLPLKLVLMPGQSFIEQPGTYSATFQEYFRKAIVSEENNLRVQVIDLASRLRTWRKNKREPLFHPNEGHLNPKGNQAVAELLKQALADRASDIKSDD